MQHSKWIVVRVLLAVSCVLVVVEASRQYGQQGGHNGALIHYGSGANNAKYNAANTAMRPNYHSYAVKPAMYGGHRMYNYRGYKRHYPMPAHYRPRHQKPGCGKRPARHPRPYLGQMNRYNNGNKGHHNKHYSRKSAANKPEMLPAGYTLKPIKALALVPVAHGSQYYNNLVQGNNAGESYGGQSSQYSGNAGRY